MKDTAWSDLQSGPCRAEEEQKTRLKCSECIAEGLRAHDITSMPLWCPLALLSRLLSALVTSSYLATDYQAKYLEPFSNRKSKPLNTSQGE